MYKKLIVVHIHTDYKFVKASKRFFGPQFNNKIIVIENSVPYSGELENEIIRTKYDLMREVLDICSQSDIIVLYGLEKVKIQLLNQIQSNKFIVWRFFGYELYGLISKHSLSEESQKYKFRNSFDKIMSEIYALYSKLFYFSPRVFKKINCVLMFDELEYSYLRQFFTHLPKFQKTPVSIGKDAVNITEEMILGKNDTIIIGNSKSIFNNHIEIINKVIKLNISNYAKFNLLFSYGSENAYTCAIRSLVSNNSRFQITEEYLNRDEFSALYKRSSALVINSYRQHALSNIFEAIHSGNKVYLNKENIVMQWLIENGISVYSVEELEHDITNSNYKLDYETAKSNQLNLIKVTNNYNNEKFRAELYGIYINFIN